jgi:hypothetical protein
VADDDPIEPPTNVDRSQEIEPAMLHVGFDRYRSLSDPNLTIFVAKDVVPPFRFKSGGWELLQSSIELGSAMKARIAEQGFFMFRANADQTGGIELTDLPFQPRIETKGE